MCQDLISFLRNRCKRPQYILRCILLVCRSFRCSWVRVPLDIMLIAAIMRWHSFSASGINLLGKRFYLILMHHNTIASTNTNLLIAAIIHITTWARFTSPSTCLTLFLWTEVEILKAPSWVRLHSTPISPPISPRDQREVLLFRRTGSISSFNLLSGLDPISGSFLYFFYGVQ